MYHLVIFDLDGTLIDSSADIHAALNLALADVGLPTHSETAVRSMIGNGVRVLVHRAVGEPAGAAAGPSGERLLEEVIRRYRAHYRTRGITDTRLYPGVAEGLARAPEVAKAVATNKPGVQARPILASLGIADRFFAVLGEDDVGATKPDPKVVELLCRRAGVARQRTLCVGDSPVDAETAGAAGVDCCLVSYGYGAPAELARACARYRADTFGDVVAIYAGR